MTPPDDFHQDDAHKAGEGEGEWISNEPPVDDFGDPAAEAATVSEGDEHAHEESASEEPPAEEKKKFPVLLLLGAVGSLAVIGGLAYWQFGGQGEQPSLLDTAAQSAASAPHFASKPAASSADTQPALPNFAAKPAASSAEAPGQAAQDVAPTTGYSVPSASGETGKRRAALQEAGSAVPTAGVSAPAPASAGIALDNMQGQAPMAPAPAAMSAPANSASDARLAALSDRIDDLQKSLSQATAQLGQISEKLNASQTQGAAPVSVPPDAAIQERLDKLEQKLAQMEQHQAAPPPPLTSVDTVFPPQTSRKSKHVSVRKPSTHKIARQAPKASKEKWVLRAATPDEAWVAKSADSRELRPVHVGDDLAGIGKVTDIRQEGDSWILRGTAGTVR
jgi:uncharacterized coiled-coil protein SlyX